MTERVRLQRVDAAATVAVPLPLSHTLELEEGQELAMRRNLSGTRWGLQRFSENTGYCCEFCFYVDAFKFAVGRAELASTTDWQ